MSGATNQIPTLSKLISPAADGVAAGSTVFFHSITITQKATRCLANTGPTVNVQFGGPEGEIVAFGTGDIVLMPAGGGHCLMAGSRASGIVGAYPAGQEDWDLKRNEPQDHKLALRQIPEVALPTTDPVTGNQFPLFNYWK